MSESKHEVATLGGGCFWCLEAAYEQLKGVERVESGYSGGSTPDPSYEAVCTGRTGHAEVVRVTFDPEVISYRDLLDIFFTIHDPTTLNRQGADVGTQYRSVIFAADDAQRRAAEEAMREWEESGAWEDPIVTELTDDAPFYRAEAHHQGYFRRNSQQPYCQAVIAPKLAKLRRVHFERLRREEEVVRAYQDEPPDPVDHGGISD